MASMTTTTTEKNATTTAMMAPQLQKKTATNNTSSLVIATRLHLGNASTAPSVDKIQGWIRNLLSMMKSLPKDGEATTDTDTDTDADAVAVADVQVVAGMIAVDATPNKIADYDFVQTIQEQVNAILMHDNDDDINDDDNSSSRRTCHRSRFSATVVVLPVTPWGQFVPALNAIVHYAHTQFHADQILFVSAEVTASAKSIRTLSHHCSSSSSSSSQKDENQNHESYVLVAGAVLNGHIYQGPFHNNGDDKEEYRTIPSDRTTNITEGISVPLNGRSCPWNTLAVWNVPKLVLTGFLSISDVGSMAGIEECAAIAVHQQLFPSARAKLVSLSDVIDWQTQDFDDDPDRRLWHEKKMNSKSERANAQLQLLNLVNKGTVEHC